MNDALVGWQRRIEVPLMTAAVLFLVAYAWPILDPGLGAGWALACEVVMWATWALFAVDYLARFVLVDDRHAFFVRHLHELAMVALPLLRPLRLLRLVTLLGVLNRRAETALRGRVIVYVTGATSLIILLAALAVLDAERSSQDAQITSMGDALWWALVSTTTVGYGDLVPTTTTGRLAAAGLMVAGIALLGTVTATLASWLVEHVQAGQQATQSDVEQLAAEVRELRVLLAERSAAPNGAPAEDVARPRSGDRS